MSIYLMLGRPGGGKSYEATVYHAFAALKKGRKVITNLPLNVPEFIKIFGEDFISEHLEIRTVAKGKPKPKRGNGISWKSSDNQQLIQKPFSTLECYEDDWRHSVDGYGALFIIDECHFVLPKGLTDVEISNWYSMHRHHGFDILLISQSHRKIDIHIIDMVELVYFVQKNKMLGDEKSYTRKIKDGVRGAIVNEDTRHYEPQFFKYYTSHTASNTAVQEAHAQDIRGFWQGGLVRSTIFLFVIVICLVIFNLTRTKEKPEAIKKLENQVALSQVSSKNEKVTLSELQAQADLRKKRKSDSGVLAVKENTVSEVANSAAPIPVKKIIRHPFYKFQVHIRGRFNMSEHEDILFVATQNGQPIFNMTLRDFYMAGYEVKVLGDCLIDLTYEDVYQEYISCTSASVGLIAQN